MNDCQLHALNGEKEEADRKVRVIVTGPKGVEDDVEWDACGICAQSIIEDSLGEDGHNPPAKDYFDRSVPERKNV